MPAEFDLEMRDGAIATVRIEVSIKNASTGDAQTIERICDLENCIAAGALGASLNILQARPRAMRTTHDVAWRGPKGAVL